MQYGNAFTKIIDPREYIEETILRFNPDITDEDLLNLREEIYLSTWNKHPGAGYYVRDYYLYSKGKHVL